MKKLAKIFLILSILFFMNLGFFEIVSAQGIKDAGTSLQEVGNTSGFGGTQTDPRVLAANIIRMALGLIGIVFVILVVYGGFLWMTSGGDDGKVKKAQGYITNGVIGLVIILLAYAITTFVINSLVQATGGTVQLSE